MKNSLKEYLSRSEVMNAILNGYTGPMAVLVKNDHYLLQMEGIPPNSEYFIEVDGNSILVKVEGNLTNLRAAGV